MEIIGIFVFIVISAIFSSTAPTTEAGSTTVRCSIDSECSSMMTCFLGGCIDKCAVNTQKGRTCKIVNGEIDYQCDPGLEFVQGDEQKICYPKDWSCNYEQKNPGHVLTCNPPKWFCRSSFGLLICVPN